ncbi:EAL and HDOD domain-containing protein [Symbioplanes lichenis]|uniref:EAL and HDOD domain-containing protein n=1 Tax=Symbioplanes lichenis TaxID=1629072 RepID=UPI002738DE46|nr:HDOD domain-containing protein [Actinoplanes lichenis]
MNPNLPPPGTQLVHVGRQPIFDETGDVVAYELLFRGSMDAVEAGRRDTYATSQVIVNAFTEFGIDEVVGDRTCFINMTREFLTGELVLPFGPEHVVLEVLETVDVDDDVIAGVAALVEQGYRIALDDFVWGSGHERLLPLASFVKLDLLGGDLTHLDEIVEACRAYPDIKIVAEGLETGEHVALSNKYGFELRQGYVLSRPQVLTAASLTPSKLRRLELLGALSAKDADLDKVLKIIAGDPALTMRVLRASNSAAVGATSRVSSVRQAVVMLGLAHIRQWAMLMVVDDVAEATETQMADALTRARLCENVASAFGATPDAAFMAGLITAVAQMLGMSPASMAHQLPLTPEIESALERGAGPLGQVLRVVNAYERGDLSEVAAAYAGHDLSGTVVAAMRWSAKAVAATQGAA